LEILATNSSPKEVSKSEREKDGRDGRVRRKLGIITVFSSKRIGEKWGGQGLDLYLESKRYPSWISSKCPPKSKSEHLKEGDTTLGLGFWYVSGG
jgi:hypothetical protein